MNRTVLVSLLILVAGLAALAIGLASGAGTAAPAGAGTVGLEPAAQAGSKPAERVVARALGRLESSSEEIGLSSDITGRIEKILVEEGDLVQARQPVAQLDHTVQRAKVDAAGAAVRVAKARQERLLAGARPEEIRRARAALEEAEAMARIAGARAERARKLGVSGASSEDETEWALRDAEGRAARARAAREELTLAEHETRSEDLAAATAELERAERELAAAEAELEKTILRSPIAGTVVRRNLRVGEAVSPFQLEPVITVADLERLRVRAEVDEIDIARVRVGQRAYVEAEPFPGLRHRGRVTRLGSTMGRKSVKGFDPNERQDVRVREVLIDLEVPADLPPGLLPLGLRLSVSFLE